MALPVGPRSTYSLPPTPQPSSRDLARAILDTIRTENARASEVRVGLMSTGCDGEPVLDPLDGTGCGNGGRKVLFHPRTRTVIGTLGKPAGSVPKTVTMLGGCDAVRARLKSRRRFIDNTGNVYGPTGKFLTWGHAPAMLETDYIHRLTNGYAETLNGTGWDGAVLRPVGRCHLQKTYGVSRASSLVNGFGMPNVRGTDDTATTSMVVQEGNATDPYVPVPEDCVFGGSYSGTLTVGFRVTILGDLASFDWQGYNENLDGAPIFGLSPFATGTSVPILHTMDSSGNTIGVEQALSAGPWVKFVADRPLISRNWIGTWTPNNDITRRGVAARGKVTRATACINGGFPNSNVIVTYAVASHSIEVRDADSLELLSTLTLAGGDPNYGMLDPAEHFSVSANDEGFFFLQNYTNATWKRKVAVISVNPETFEPTIEEVLTLEDNAHTAGATFAVATTLAS